MSDSTWRDAQTLFHRCVDLDSTEQQAQLAAAPEPVRREVESLLAAHQHAERLIDQPVADARRWFASPPSTPTQTTKLGSIGPYRLVRKLGEGGFGTVYLAERLDGDFRLEVAIKQARQELRIPGMEARLKLERRILARFDHPNIARLFDGGTDDSGRPYLVMEYIEGEPLDRYCDRHRLGLTERIALLALIIDAVAYAHRRLVIHRDLKPSNILVTADGTPKLFDFGIAKLLEEAAEGGMTLTGLVPFTPSYASPEQVKGGDLTTASDVYAIGVLLYRLLTGHLPYDIPADTPARQIEQIILETPPRPFAEAFGAAASNPRCAPLDRLQGDLENITRMALRKEPERRYPSVQDLGDDLQRHLANLPVHATGDSLPYRASRFVRRHRLAVLSSVLVALALALGMVTTISQMRQAQRQKARAEQVTRLLVDDVFGAAAPGRARGQQPTAREILDASIVALDRRLATSPDVHGTVLAAVGRLYQSLGAYDRAATFLERGHGLLESFHDPHHPDVLATRSDWADIALDQGRYDQAETLLVSAITAQRRHGRRGRAALATSLHRLAMVEQARERPTEARAALDEALAIRVRQFGAASLEVAASLAIRAQLDFTAGDVEAAEAATRQALAIRRNRLGIDHPDTLVSLNDAAVMVQHRGDLPQAEVLFREVVAVNERIHGPEHRNLANALANLGWVVSSRGRTQEAIQLLQRARSIRIATLGPGHDQVRTDTRSLARFHQQARNWPDAERLLRENLALAAQDDANSLASARALLDLAALDFDRGRFHEAATRYGEVAERLAQHLPDSDWRRVLPLFERGRALREVAELAEAESLLRRAWHQYEAILGPDTVRVWRARAELGLCLRGLGQTEEADTHLLPSLEALRQALPPTDPGLRWIEERWAGMGDTAASKMLDAAMAPPSMPRL